jgi:hypothetical protein
MEMEQLIEQMDTVEDGQVRYVDLLLFGIDRP